VALTVQKKYKPDKSNASQLQWPKFFFRIYSFRKYIPSQHEFFVPEENDVRFLCWEDNTILDVLRYFCSIEGIGTSSYLCFRFAEKLEELEKALLAEAPMTLLNSSVLLMFEGDSSPYSSDLLPDIRLIDFDKAVMEQDEKDRDKSCCLPGIRNLAKMLREIGGAVRSFSAKQSYLPLMNKPSPPIGRRRSPSDPMKCVNRERRRGVVPDIVNGNRSLVNFANQDLQTHEKICLCQEW